MKNYFTKKLACFFLLSWVSFFTIEKTMAQKVITNYWGYTTKIRQQYQVDANGAENGYWKSYSDEGKILESFNYFHGKKNGKQISYYEGISQIIWCYGKPLKIENYNNGDRIGEESYKCNDGKPYLNYKVDKIKSGAYEQFNYHPNGKVKEHFFTIGILTNNYIGKYESFYESGKLHYLYNYHSTAGNLMAGLCFGLAETGDTTLKVLSTQTGLTYLIEKYDEKQLLSRMSIDTINWTKRVEDRKWDRDPKLTIYQNWALVPFQEYAEKIYGYSNVGKNGVPCSKEISSWEAYSRILKNENCYTSNGKLPFQLDGDQGEFNSYIIATEIIEYNKESTNLTIKIYPEKHFKDLRNNDNPFIEKVVDLKNTDLEKYQKLNSFNDCCKQLGINYQLPLTK
jgi:hypothetical protein